MKKETTPKKQKINWRNVRFFSILAAGLLISVGLIVTAIVLLAQPRHNYTADLVAEINLSDGTKLVYELQYEKAPIAVANFVYRAQHGYYNGSAFFPVREYTRGSVVISGLYREYTSTSQNVPLLKTGFEYTINKDAETLGNNTPQVGTLITWNETPQGSTTGLVEGGFAIFLDPDDRGSKTGYFNNSVAFGIPVDENTYKFLDELAKAEADANGVPANPAYKLKIKSIKISAKDSKFWKNFDYKTQWEEGKEYNKLNG